MTAMLPKWRNVLNLANMNSCLKAMEFAATGAIDTRATEITQELEKGVQRPFTSVIKANIGDAHAMGQTPITFIRQVLSLVTYPKMMDNPEFPSDVKRRANAILDGCKGRSVGSYSSGIGIDSIRKNVARYVTERDGGIPCDYENIVLCAGATEGIMSTLKMFISINNTTGKRPGIMVPIPQYPLYSATITEYNMHQIDYYLDEACGWSLDAAELKRAINVAKKTSVPRAIVVINPGNPTGQVLTRQNIEEMIKFAYEEQLFIFADEVYQHNVYGKECEFHSFKKVITEMGEPYKNMELASFMSCSKGYMGECGLRGGYFEIINMDPKVRSVLATSISTKLCPTVIGQAAIDCVVNTPQPGEPSYELYKKEREEVLQSLAKRAKHISESFNAMPGFQCNEVQGAMYAYPQVKLPEKAIEAAKAKGLEPDVFYAFQLLENTGICVVPGSGFGQQPNTYHFRTTILQQPRVLDEMMEKFKAFHEKFTKQYSQT